LEYLKSVVANAESKINCEWFRTDVIEIETLYPGRFNKLVKDLKNGVSSASETSLNLAEHIHVQIPKKFMKDYVEWKEQGKDINSLEVFLTRFTQR